MNGKNLLTLVLNFDDGREKRLRIIGPEWPRTGDYFYLKEKVGREEIIKKYHIEKIEYIATPSFNHEDEVQLARCNIYLKKIE